MGKNLYFREPVSINRMSKFQLLLIRLFFRKHQLGVILPDQVSIKNSSNIYLGQSTTKGIYVDGSALDDSNVIMIRADNIYDWEGIIKKAEESTKKTPKIKQ
jgi:hypothetical protein